MIILDDLKKNTRKFVALTSLTPEEFDYLLPAFERAYLNVCRVRCDYCRGWY